MLSLFMTRLGWLLKKLQRPEYFKLHKSFIVEHNTLLAVGSLKPVIEFFIMFNESQSGCPRMHFYYLHKITKSNVPLRVQLSLLHKKIQIQR